MKIKYEIIECFANNSVLEYLKSFYLGKSKINNLLESKKISVNGDLANRNTILNIGDILEIDYEEEIDFIPDKKKLDIVYEDDYLLIVNKPANILVHPDDKTKNGTMVNIVSNYYHNKGYKLSIKYAHRLDVDTTGLLIFAKDSLTKAAIDKLISVHELKRTYLCLAEGKFKNKRDIINAPIGEDRHHNQRRRVSKTGQEAITYYEVLKEFKGYSLLKVQLETGRTHQIRVHLAYINHPLVGDELYGARMLYDRFMLHSYKVDFIHPVTRKRIVIVKDIPYDMKKLVGRESDKDAIWKEY